MPAKGDTTGNSRDLHAITQEVKHYLQLQKRYMALDAVEKVTRLLSAVAVAVVCLILGAMILFFTLYALAEWIGALLGSAALLTNCRQEWLPHWQCPMTGGA